MPSILSILKTRIFKEIEMYKNIWVSAFAPIDLKNTMITIQDGSTPPNTIEVTIGEGNLTYNEQRSIEYHLNKGTLDTTREGDDVPVDVSLDFRWDYVSGITGNESVEDAIKGIRTCSSWVSSDITDPCAPYACDIVIVQDNQACDDNIETITLGKFRWEGLNHDASAASIACTGKCNIKQADVVRTSSS